MSTYIHPELESIVRNMKNHYSTIDDLFESVCCTTDYSPEIVKEAVFHVTRKNPTMASQTFMGILG